MGLALFATGDLQQSRSDYDRAVSTLEQGRDHVDSPFLKNQWLLHDEDRVAGIRAASPRRRVTVPGGRGGAAGKIHRGEGRPQDLKDN
jgi:hypothetical protein